MAPKRTENFTVPEKEMVVRILDQYSYIVENKATDGKTCKEKELAWLDIANSFNATTTGVKRTPSQLQNLWRSLKQKTKKGIAARRQLIAVGHTPHPPMDELTQKIFSIIPGQIEPLTAAECSPEIVTDETSTPLPRKRRASSEMQGIFLSPEAMSNQTIQLAQTELEMKLRLCEMQLETERLKQQRERRRIEMDEELHEIKVKRMKEHF